MNHEEVKALTPGAEVHVNGRGDLMMDGDVKHIIGQRVQFQRLTKKGLMEVRFEERLYYVPPKNVQCIG